MAGENGVQGVRASVITRTYERNENRRTLLVERVKEVPFCLTLDYLAGILGHDNFKQRLIDDGILDVEGFPYLHYLDCGFFAVTNNVLLTPDGQTWLIDRYPPTAAALAAQHAAENATVQ